MQFFERTRSPAPAGAPVGVLEAAGNWSSVPHAAAPVDGDR